MKKVLIIDDAIAFQKTMAMKLKSKGYDIAQAFDGEEGLDKAIKENPDIILLDIKMPKMEGIELLTKLRANKDVRVVPVFITSNISTPEVIGDGVVLGVQGYIVKSDETLDTIASQVAATLDPVK